MRNTVTKVQEHNAEMGRLLEETRTRKKIPATACANIIGTSRRRYAEMEAGTTLIGASELLLLMEFLDIPFQRVWPEAGVSSSGHQIVIPARPGEVVQIKFSIIE